ncbi:MAG: BON domain-containing protein, partial [Gemmatimonadaceae bacterium]
DDEEAEDDEEIDDDESPERVERQVLAAFSEDAVLSDRAIEISVDAEGNLELGGWVGTAREARQARRVARRVPGVASVVLKLVVGNPLAGADRAAAAP